MNDFQIRRRANGDFDVEHLQRQPREERPQDAEKGVSGMVGAEKAQGHSRASTESARDLPELRSQEELDQERRVPIWAWPVAAFKALLWVLGLGRLL